MKKQNRRSKQTSAATADSSSPPPKTDDKQPQQHCETRLHDLEKENEALKKEIEELKCNLTRSPASSDGFRKLKENGFEKLHVLEEQVMELKKKLNIQYQLSTLRQRTGGLGKQHQDEIQRLKTQKVQLICKRKLESVQFRLSKALLEKEILQLKKEKRRKEYEMHKLLASNQRQKKVLMRKTEEASMATKRLTELLESRKASSQSNCGTKNDNSHGIQSVELELKVAARVEEIHAEYDRQMEEMAEELRKFEEEAETLREENFRFLLQQKEVDCMARDSELADLKEELSRLNNLVNELLIRRTNIDHVKELQADPAQSSVSVESSISNMASESGSSGGSSYVTATSSLGSCCSCSKKSLCKTTKCECRAAGGCCGTGCGCSTSKCTNRVLKVEGLPQPDVGQQYVQGSDTPETEKNVTSSQPSEPGNSGEPRRTPLGEIRNTQINTNPEEPDEKIKGKKPVTRPDTLGGLRGPRKADKTAPPEIPVKLTRATRSTTTNKSS